MKTFREEMLETAINQHLIALHESFNTIEEGFVGGVTLEGEVTMIHGIKRNGEPSKIVVANVGNTEEFEALMSSGDRNELMMNYCMSLFDRFNKEE